MESLTDPVDRVVPLTFCFDYVSVRPRVWFARSVASTCEMCTIDGASSSTRQWGSRAVGKWRQKGI